MDNDVTIVVGPAHDGALLEVGYVSSQDGQRVIIHAMPARPKYLER